VVLKIYFYLNAFFSLIKNSKRDIDFFRIHFFFEKPTKGKSTIKLAWHHVKNSMQNRISLVRVRPPSNFISLNFHFADETWPITVGYIIICQAVDTWHGGATAKNWYRPIGKVPPRLPPPPLPLPTKITLWDFGDLY